jgi:hypothetical protein
VPPVQRLLVRNREPRTDLVDHVLNGYFRDGRTATLATFARLTFDGAATLELTAELDRRFRESVIARVSTVASLGGRT